MLFTVFTPTFNRAALLPRLYESLCRQTFRDFEWVIVDDGSTDNTAAVVDEPVPDTILPKSEWRQAYRHQLRRAEGQRGIVSYPRQR